MKENELRKKINAVSQSSAIFKKIGKFIENNWESICFMTATEVAKKLNISQGSVSRFCSELGFVGFNEFVKIMQEIHQEGAMTAPKRLEKIKNDESGYKEIIESEKNNLNMIPEIMLKNDFKNIVDKIVKSKKVILISARLSATLLQSFEYTLSKIRDNVEIVIPGSSAWNNIVLNNPKDTFVFVISFPRYPALLLNKLKDMNDCGYEIGLMTNSMVCPLISFSKYYIEVPISYGSFFDIYTTATVLLNFIVMEAAKKIKNLEKRINELEKYEQKEITYIS
ncbi:MurR/RpiR family transcriptional regulator [Clostridium sp. BJN0001]|uniref:MurR/RpiR family transcriptional regulator n=1 Tax=Clostridium sp. BJN0001 TaxID=2930219 RepID=UPI001FD2F609|nr:MurR/RpiR family transcriptional regulator [Clostridium sp. BJN0001]